jgi:hypothetical protein
MAGEPARNGRLDANGHRRPGTAVEVRSRFDGGWCHGFEVAEALDTAAGVAYRVRRVSDGAVLPALFRPDEVATVR